MSPGSAAGERKRVKRACARGARGQHQGGAAKITGKPLGQERSQGAGRQRAVRRTPSRWAAFAIDKCALSE